MDVQNHNAFDVKNMLNELAISYQRKIVFVPTTINTIIPMQCRAHIPPSPNV